MVILLMTPAAYHRIVYAGEDSATFQRLGSILITCATIPLALGLAADVFVVTTKIASSHSAALLSSGAVLLLLAGCWYVLPLWKREQRATARPPDEGVSKGA